VLSVRVRVHSVREGRVGKRRVFTLLSPLTSGLTQWLTQKHHTAPHVLGSLLLSEQQERHATTKKIPFQQSHTHPGRMRMD
jgi:hypothetical protein